jgi:hypothetical protein
VTVFDGDKEIEQAMEAATGLADRLGAETDLLNKEIRDVEGIMLALNLGVEVGLPLDLPDEPDIEFCRYSSWGLFVHNDKAKTFVPLLKASRGIRVAAALRLRELLLLLVETAEDDLKEVQSAVAELHGFIGSMPNVSPRKSS